MTHSFLRRTLLGLAMLMMVVAMAGYAAHSHGDAAHAQDSAHCDFCAAFSATADLPAHSFSAPLAHPDSPLPLPAGRGVAATALRAHPPRAPPVHG